MRHVLGTCMDCLVPCQSMFHGLSLDQPGYRSPVTEIWRQRQQKEGIRERNMGHQWPQTGVNAAWPWNMAIQFSNLTSWGGTMCSVGKRKFFGMKSERRWSLLNKESSLYYGYHFGDEESKNQSKWLVQCQKLITRNIVCKLCVFWLEPKCFFPLYYSCQPKQKKDRGLLYGNGLSWLYSCLYCHSYRSASIGSSSAAFRAG